MATSHGNLTKKNRWTRLIIMHGARHDRKRASAQGTWLLWRVYVCVCVLRSGAFYGGTGFVRRAHASSTIL